MITVVILTRNRLPKLKRCLRSLGEQTALSAQATGAKAIKDFEVVVLDNGSTDGTLEFLNGLTLSPLGHQASPDLPQDLFFPLRTIRATGEESFAELRNRGCAAARGEVIAFLDDDCWAEKHWLERIARAIKDHDAIGGLVLADGPLPWPKWWDGGLNWLIGLSPPQLAEADKGGIFYPQTANLALRKAVWEQEPFQSAGRKPVRAGRLYRTGREDALLWRRLRTKGYRVRIEPTVIVYHSIAPARLKLRNLWRRAYNDGWAYYMREGKREYLSTACNQLVSMPLSVLESWVKKLVGRRGFFEHGKDSLSKPLVKEGLWAIRQLGFLGAHVVRPDKLSLSRHAEKKPALYRSILEGGSVLALLDIGFKLATATVKHLADQVKRPLRRGLILTHRNLVRKQAIKTPPASLLIVSCGFLGDMIIIQPSVRLLRDYYPDTKLSLLCYQNGKEIYEHIPLFDEILICPPEREEAKRFLSEMVWERAYSAIIIHYYHYASPVPLLWENQTPIIGYDDDIGFSRRLWYELVDYPVSKNFRQNEILNSLKLLELLGISGQEPLPYHFTVPPEIEARIKQLLAASIPITHKLTTTPTHQPNFVAINMGAGYRAKEWARENWAQLAHYLQDIGYFLVFVGDKWWRWEARYILERRGVTGLNLCGQTSIMELAAVLKQCRFLITTDSGPKHLAFALGVPTVTLYGVTEERRWGALWEKEKHRAVRGCPADLTPEERFGLPENHQMLCITPEMVLSAEAILAKAGAK